MTTKDPLGLFPVANPTPSAEPSPQPGTGLAYLVLGLLIGVFVLLAWQRMDERFRRGDGQHQEQNDQQASLKASGVAFVHERDGASIEQDLLLREMVAWTTQNGLTKGFRVYDDDMTDQPVPELIAFAKSQSIDPPFAVLLDKDGKPARAIPFPDTLDALNKLIK